MQGKSSNARWYGRAAVPAQHTKQLPRLSWPAGLGPQPWPGWQGPSSAESRHHAACILTLNFTHLYHIVINKQTSKLYTSHCVLLTWGSQAMISPRRHDCLHFLILSLKVSAARQYCSLALYCERPDLPSPQPGKAFYGRQNTVLGNTVALSHNSQCRQCVGSMS